MTPSLSFSGLKGPFVQASFGVREHERTRFGLIRLDDGRDGTNAIGRETLEALAAALDDADRAEVSALAVIGNRRWFSSGADLTLLQQTADRTQAIELIRRGHEVFRRFAENGRPTFAFISGVATGG